MQPVRAVLLFGAVGSSLALAGCASAPAGPGELHFTAAWGPWSDDALPHLILTFSNIGQSPVYVGPGGQEIQVTGPTGTVPVYWGETPLARTIYPNQVLTVGFHPRLGPDGGFTLAIDHAWGIPAPAAPGIYVACAGSTCEPAKLGTG